MPVALRNDCDVTVGFSRCRSSDCGAEDALFVRGFRWYLS